MNFPTVSCLAPLHLVDRGIANQERLLLVALEYCDLGQCALVKALKTGQSFTPTTSDFFWLPDQALEAGQFVLVYSGRGQSRWSTLVETNSTTHVRQNRNVYVVHLGSAVTLYNDPRTFPLLIAIGGMAALPG